MPVAVLSLERHAGARRDWTDDDRELVEEIAGRAALALDNALLLAEERAAAERLSLLQRATAELSAAATPIEVADVTVEHLRALFGASARVAVFEYEPDARTLTPLAARNVDPPVVTAPARSRRRLVGTAVEPRRARCGWSAARRPPPRRTTATPPLDALLRREGVRGAVAAAPAWRRAPRSARSASACPTAPRVSRTERTTLEALAEPCAKALDRARLYRAEHQIADTLQRSLLPQGLPELDRLGLAARYLPGAEGTQAGGDWYDVVELDDAPRRDRRRRRRRPGHRRPRR